MTFLKNLLIGAVNNVHELFDYHSIIYALSDNIKILRPLKLNYKMKGHFNARFYINFSSIVQ